MKQRLATIIAGALLISGFANAWEPRQLPSLAGPNLYEVYTDASLYSTRVKVNGIVIPLANADGYGVMAQDGFYISGPTGYPNVAHLNGWMKAGVNHIEVEFIPSPPIEKYVDKPVLKKIARLMLSQVVIVRGQLNKARMGLESKELEAALQANLRTSSIDILFNKKLAGQRPEHVMDTVIYHYEIELPLGESAKQVSLAQCELDTTFSPYSFTGSLFLNGMPLRQVEYNRSRLQGELRESIKNGENEFVLEVDTIKEDSSARLMLECDMRDLVVGYAMDSKYPLVGFGENSHIRRLPLLNLELGKAGIYKGSFDMRLP